MPRFGKSTPPVMFFACLLASLCNYSHAGSWVAQHDDLASGWGEVPNLQPIEESLDGTWSQICDQFALQFCLKPSRESLFLSEGRRSESPTSIHRKKARLIQHFTFIRSFRIMCGLLKDRLEWLTPTMVIRLWRESVKHLCGYLVFKSSDTVRIYDNPGLDRST